MTNQNKVVELAKIIDDLTSREVWSALSRDERGMVRAALLYGSRKVRLFNREELDIKKKLQES